MQWTALRALPAFLLLLLFTATVSAQPKITFAPAKTGRIDGLIPVMAQAVRCIALSEAQSLLAFGHDRTYPNAHVSLVRLDAKGTPAAYAIPLTLPRPKGLEKFPQYVTGVCFHPTLPLLYVWQDIAIAYSNPPPPAPPETMQFDHLHIFNIAKESPELLVSLCRGQEFIYGQGGGDVAVDPTGSFLYVPNLREIKNAGSLRLGRYPLGADGLPALSDAKDPKKLTELNIAGKAGPPQMTPIEYVNLFHVSQFGCGQRFHPISKDVVIASVQSGLLTWRPEDKTATVHGMPLKGFGHTRFVVHPTLPAIFATSSQSANPDSFFRAEHAEGYLTLLPKQYAIPDSKLSGPPAVLSKQKKVAVGGQYFVYLLDLDEKAFPIDGVIRTQVNCPQVRALAYSERFDRLYVGVEVSR